MKKAILFLALVSGMQILSAQYCGTSGTGQCTSPGLLTQPGFGPPFGQATPIIDGVPVNAVVEFLNYDTLHVSGVPLTMDSVTIDSINNLPAGLCWFTNKATNTFGMGEDGCIKLTGITNAAPGQYKLDVFVSAYTNISPAPNPISTNASALGLFYYVRVNCSGAAVVVPLDTTPNNSSAPAFKPYTASNCNPGPPVVSLDSNQTVCNNSALILNPVISGGKLPFTYSWQYTGNALSCNNCANPTVTLTQTSTYTLAVTDANNYTSVASVTYTVSATNNLITLSTANTNINCASAYDTTTLTVASGTQPFNVNWGDGNTQSGTSTTSPLHIYNTAGDYVISITDASGCASALFDTVLNNGIIVTLNNSVSPNCYSMSTGSLQVSVSGGTPPYTYNWSNLATTNPITALPSGSYSLTVTDNTGCTADYNTYILPLSDPWGYYTYLTPAATNCSNNGSVTSAVYGGAPPYTYAWSNSSTTANLTSLSGGFYNLTVTDSAGCQTTGSAYINSSCYSYINGVAFIDSNGNCIYDPGELPYTSLYIVAYSSTGNYFYGSTDNNGNYSIQVADTGTYSLVAYNYYAGGFECGNLTFCNNSTQTIHVPVLGDTVNNANIGFSGTTGFNLGIHPGWTTANPGFTKQYWVYYYNSASSPYNGPATITFNYDPNLQYLYSDDSIAPNVDTTNHVITWLVDSVGSLNSAYFWTRLDAYFQVPATLSLNYLLQSTFTITPKAGDCDTSDNQYSYSETVIGSHDPNEKTVSPSGPVTAEDSVLTYTIHFQNTGTDSTHFIVIKDTLSPNLDPATVRNIASSDKYSAFNISGAGILTWTFNPLRVVDSATNPSASKRFIMFTVHKKHNLPIGTTINNTAYVYFDYNTAVVTNTVSDTEAVLTNIFEVSTTSSNINVKAFPNPFNDVTHIVVTGINEKFGFELYDVTGRLQQTIPSIDNSQFDVHKGQLSNGVYLYRILVTGKPAAFGKLVVE